MGGERAVDVGVDECDGEGSLGRGSSLDDELDELDWAGLGEDAVRWSTGDGEATTVLDEGPAREEDAEGEDAI